MPRQPQARDLCWASASCPIKMECSCASNPVRGLPPSAWSGQRSRRSPRERCCRDSLVMCLQLERGVDEPDMGETLRKVPQSGACMRVNFLCEQSEIVPVGQQILELAHCFRAASLQDVILDFPEPADSERPFAWRQPVALPVAV